MAKEFYNKLINYVSVNDTKNANNLLMQEVGKSLVKDKSNFIELLTASGVPASESMSDVELVDSFVNAIPNNKSLMIGTAYMINADNKFVSADGMEHISDKGVKVCYNVMYDFFNCEDSNETEFRNADGEEYSNAGWSEAVRTIADVGGKITEGVMKTQDVKKRGASTGLQKQQEARQQMIQSIMAERKAKLENANKQKELKSKRTKTILLVTGGIIALGIIGFVVYKFKKK